MMNSAPPSGDTAGGTQQACRGHTSFLSGHHHHQETHHHLQVEIKVRTVSPEVNSKQRSSNYELAPTLGRRRRQKLIKHVPVVCSEDGPATKKAAREPYDVIKSPENQTE